MFDVQCSTLHIRHCTLYLLHHDDGIQQQGQLRIMVRLVGSCPPGVRVFRLASATTVANILRSSWKKSTWVSYTSALCVNNPVIAVRFCEPALGPGGPSFWPPRPHTHGQTQRPTPPPLLLFLPHTTNLFLSFHDPVCSPRGHSHFEPDCGASPVMYDASLDHQIGLRMQRKLEEMCIESVTTYCEKVSSIARHLHLLAPSRACDRLARATTAAIQVFFYISFPHSVQTVRIVLPANFSHLILHIAFVVTVLFSRGSTALRDLATD